MHSQGEEEDEEEAPFEDIKSITVRRHKLEQWLNEPFFEATMIGCMVRAALRSLLPDFGDFRIRSAAWYAPRCACSSLSLVGLPPVFERRRRRRGCRPRRSCCAD